MSLLDSRSDEVDKNAAREERHFLMTARGNDKSIELECIAASSDANLEDKMVLLKERAESVDESDLSLCVLSQVTSSFQQQQYHDTDIITVKVEA